ncbi:mannosyl-3-phosphoglycerate phosphatase [Pseudoruegeria sp. HB172150]|uniref:HAD-IIB family hydrolase n=1 Tax=Pseudoruegeria sp. HB172150 TaxID=2721164 RepID=UPI001555CD6F|nr:HAD-IIB family hydrolase [Pseudoruegeria sp. HB172150]
MRLLVFTDLDGTLLDHATYSYAAARPALTALRDNGVPLVLASSKTGAEIRLLHQELELGDAPAIVENGAGIYWPAKGAEDDPADYRRIREALAGMPEAEGYRGFGDMSDAEVSEVTGLPVKQAALARQRCHSEPGLWHGTDDARQAFLSALEARGIAARSGGRFLTLSFGRTKADAMGEVTERLGAERTIALGDAPNDAEMLALADFGVIVRNDHAPPMDLPEEAAGRISRTDLPGPAGWNKAVLRLLEETGMN